MCLTLGTWIQPVSRSTQVGGASFPVVVEEKREEGAIEEASPLHEPAPVPPVLAAVTLPEPAVIAVEVMEVGRWTPPVLLAREPVAVSFAVLMCCFRHAVSKLIVKFMVGVYLRQRTWHHWCPWYA